MRRIAVLLLVALVIARPVLAADRHSLDAQMVAGYQGWFACPADAGQRGGWNHWFARDGTRQWRPTIDMLPDDSELTPGERCESGLTSQDGRPIALFSARNATTVDRHFAWMAQYGIGVAAVQRFTTRLDNVPVRQAADIVLANARMGAERHGVGFFIMYDASGLTAERAHLLVEDLQALRQQGVLDSPAYQHHRGQPLLAIYGLGLRSRPIGAAAAATLLAEVRALGPVTLMGGVPAAWRTLDGDAQPDPAWAAVYRSFEVLSPWSVGRYRDDAGADNFRRERIEPDLRETRARGIDYLPVIFPGFTWYNLMTLRGQGETPANRSNWIARRCGAFYWHQAGNAMQAGARMLYTAMFDEVDEGTAIFKLAPTQRDLPPGGNFVALDQDGCRLPSDWYLGLARRVGAALAAGQGLDAMPAPPR